MYRRIALILFASLGAAGCAKFHVPAKLPWSEDEPELVTPDRMEVVWTNAILHKAGQASTRGFGGRIVFHAQDQKSPVMVDGQLTVYGFANEDPTMGDAPPEKKFVFPQDIMAKHESDSMVGPSYSFWLPWDEVNGRQRQLSLVARFEDASGKVVMSKIAHVTLPGRIAQDGKPGPGPLAQDPYPVRQTAFEKTDDAKEPESSKHPQSTTINVTPSFSRKILTPVAPGRMETRTVPADSTSPAPTNSYPPSEQEETSQDSPSAANSTSAAARGRLSPTAVRRQPHRAEWPHRLPPTPRSGWQQTMAERADDSDSSLSGSAEQ